MLDSSIQDPVIATVTKLAANNTDIAAIWLYGSRAKGTNHKNSDYDIAIAYNNFKLSPTEKLIRPNEQALVWAQQVGLSSDLLSVVDINTIPIYLALNVIEYGKVIYVSDPLRVIKEQNRISSKYEFQHKENALNG